MKNYILITFSLFLFACDVIEEPYLESNNQSSQKMVLIEKFTGHKCSNCPDATRKIKLLQEYYNNAIIPVAIHPGELSGLTGVDENYTYDFTTSSGNLIANDMGADFLPLGTVNRIEGGVSDRCFIPDDWSSEINKLLYDSEGIAKERKFDIDIQTTFNTITKELIVETSVLSLSNLQGFFKLAIIITEDKIIAPQDDGADGRIADYEHNDIYRCAINGTYGENINSVNDLDSLFEYQTSHTLILNQDANTNWTSDWENVNNCYVIAYVYDSESLIIEDSIKQAIINE